MLMVFLKIILEMSERWSRLYIEGLCILCRFLLVTVRGWQLFQPCNPRSSPSGGRAGLRVLQMWSSPVLAGWE